MTRHPEQVSRVREKQWLKPQGKKETSGVSFGGERQARGGTERYREARGGTARYGQVLRTGVWGCQGAS